jgi:hypothetical protein
MYRSLAAVVALFYQLVGDLLSIYVVVKRSQSREIMVFGHYNDGQLLTETQ